MFISTWGVNMSDNKIIGLIFRTFSQILYNQEKNYETLW